MKRLPFWSGLGAVIIIAAIFLHSLLFNITKPVDFSYTDTFLHMFVMKYSMDTILSGKFARLPDFPMWVGSVSHPLYFQDYYIAPYLISTPIYVLTKDIITTFNSAVVITIMLSVISMYLLAWHFTESPIASVLAAVIFVLNPFIFGRVPDHFNLISLEWIPLIFLMFEKLLQNNASRYALFLFIFLTGQLLTSSYYFAFLTVILPFYGIFRLWQTGKRITSVLNPGFVIGAAFLIITVIGYYSLYARHLPSISSPEFYRRDSPEQYSAWPTDWLFTGPNNMLYGNLRMVAFSKFPKLVFVNEIIEHNLFIGIVPILLLIISFVLLFRSKVKNLRLLLLGLMIFCVMFSFGTGTPVFTLLSKIHPMLTYARVPARMAVFAFFFIALIDSLAVMELQGLIHSKKLFRGITYVLTGIILLEYWNIPTGFLVIPANTQKFYQSVKDNRDANVILDYPMGNLLPVVFPQHQGITLETHHMFWTFFHNKKLFNGYGSFTPTTYYKRAQLLSLVFPNVTTIIALRQWGVGGIILHKDEMVVQGEYEKIKNALIALGVPLVTSTDDLAFFDLKKWSAQQIP